MAHIMKLDKKPEVICGRKNVFIICQSELFRIWVAYLISRKNAPVPITIFIARMTLSGLQSLRCDPGWKEGGGRDAVILVCLMRVRWLANQREPGDSNGSASHPPDDGDNSNFYHIRSLFCVPDAEERRRRGGGEGEGIRPVSSAECSGQRETLGGREDHRIRPCWAELGISH